MVDKSKIKKVQAQYLKKGDKLAFYKDSVITSSPSVGIKTPSGKVELGVDGYLKVWNKRTEISILID